jgi:hypothetical protein
MIDRLELIKQRHLERLRRVETAILDEVHNAGLTDDEVKQVAPELRDISDAIMKIESGEIWWVIGAEGTVYLCEDTGVAS